MDGGFHFKDKFGETVEESQAKDRYKDKLAKENGCIMIRIPCLESNLEYLKDQIEASEINRIFDLSVVDWEKVRMDCANSKLYKVCSEYEKCKNDPTMSVVKLAQKLDMSVSTVRKYLQRADKMGIIKYDAFHPKKPERYIGFVEYKNEHPWLSNKELSQQLHIPVATIQSYSERAQKNGEFKFRTPMEYKMVNLVNKYIKQKDSISKRKFCDANDTTVTTLNKYLRKAGLYEPKK